MASADMSYQIDDLHVHPSHDNSLYTSSNGYLGQGIQQHM